MHAKLLLLHALSPLHAGTGQGVDVIDLPIAREKATRIPIVPGSSLKGVLRDACNDADVCPRVFGPTTNNAADFAGSAQFTDMRLLLLPVRSLAGTFAWVTSPLLLRRFLRDAANADKVTPPQKLPQLADDTKACAVSNDRCVLTLSSSNTVVLEDLVLTPTKSAEIAGIAGWLATQLFPSSTYWQSALKARFCLVHDDVLTFLLQTATEVTARITLDDDKKTVKKGQLWYEEALPAETVLSGLVVDAQVKSKPGEVFKTVGDLVKNPVQVGGNATVGRGLCQLQLIGG